MAQPAAPMPASTVVLVRPSEDGAFEIFMNRRPEKMETYAGVYVFPGGRVERTDWSSTMLNLVRGISPEDAQQKLDSASDPEVCLGYWVAAVRELFEEAGIHFFVPQNNEPATVDTTVSAERLAHKRAELQAGKFDLPTFMVAERLYCDVGRLRYFFHRITPDHYPVRFDTRFYLAVLPQGQTPLHSSEEVSDSLWVSPRTALDSSQSGNFPMMPPTIAVLRTLADYQSWHSLCTAFRLR
jgi:8-oxo-dGTP pyrophosphatase MutT (NUDIX family)